jgi:hypothetical protein
VGVEVEGLRGVGVDDLLRYRELSVAELESVADLPMMKVGVIVPAVTDPVPFASASGPL